MDSSGEGEKRKSLQDIGLKFKNDKALTHHYLDYYESRFGHLRDEPINLLEIGTLHGRSMRMWNEYFQKGEIYGIDIRPPDRAWFDSPRLHLSQVYQTDERLRGMWPNRFFDIIIDDGSHFTYHQQKTLEILWLKVKPKGFYVIEDINSSLRKKYNDAPVSTLSWIKGETSNMAIDWIRQEAEYINIYCKGEPSPRNGITCIIRKKSYGL